MKPGVSIIPVVFWSKSGLAAARPAATGLRNGSMWVSTDTKDIDQVQVGAWVTIFDYSNLAGAISTHEGLPNIHHAPTTGRMIVTGNYTGNQVARQITTGFKCSYVTLQNRANSRLYILVPSACMYIVGGSANFMDKTAAIYLHASDGFYLTGVDGNLNSTEYYWWAISE